MTGTFAFLPAQAFRRHWDSRCDHKLPQQFQPVLLLRFSFTSA